MIAVSSYLIKHRSKQKHLLPYHETSKFKEIDISEKGFKYFIGYEDDSKKNMLLCIMVPKMSAYRRDFDETKYMSFLIKDNELFEKYNEI